MIPDAKRYLIRCKESYQPTDSLQQAYTSGTVELFAEVNEKALPIKANPSDSVFNALKQKHVTILTEDGPEGSAQATAIFHQLHGHSLSAVPVVPSDSWTTDLVIEVFKSGFKKGASCTRQGRRELRQFHKINQEGFPVGVKDSAIRDGLKRELPMFILGKVPYIYEGGMYKADESGAELSTKIDGCIYPEFSRADVIERVFRLFIKDKSLEAEAEDLNAYPCQWVNFRNGYYDPTTGKLHQHDPKHKAVNQIPHKFEPGKDQPGPTVDRFLKEAIPDAEDREMFLQFAGYCMTTNTSLQRFMILNGDGGTGKSTLLHLLEHVIGTRNLTSVSLQELEQRFSAYNLVGKLLNSCADIPLTALEDVSTIKKLIGEDLLQAEAKNKMPFTFRSYAKLIFSTNELPIVKGERTSAMYRRLLILNMNQKPERIQLDLEDKLKAEALHFIFLCMEALARLYRDGLTISANSEAAADQMRMESDTVEAFLHDKTSKKPGARVERGELYRIYSEYCYSEGRKELSRMNFYKALSAKGYGEARTAKARYITGVSLDVSDKLDTPDTPVTNSGIAAIIGGQIVQDEPLPFL